MIQRCRSLLLLILALPASASARPAWTHETQGLVWAAPVVTPDGRIFVGSEDGFFYGFAPGGQLRWSYRSSAGFAGWPVLVDRGTLAAGNRNGRVYFFSLTGDLLAEVAIGGPTEGPPALSRGDLVLAVRSGQVVALRDRQLRWFQPTGSPITTWPAVDPAGRIHVGCADGSLLALAPDGRKLWRKALGVPFRGALLADRSGVTGANEAGEVLALSTRGAVRFRRQLGRISTGVARFGRGILVGTEEGILFALGDDGTPLWRFTAGGPLRSAPVVVPARALGLGGSQVILAGTEAGTLFALDPSGTPLALFAADGAIRGGVTVAGGRIHFGSADRRLYVLPAANGTHWGTSTALKNALARAPRGVELWRRHLSGPVAQGVSAGPRGMLLAGTWGAKVYAVDRRGTIQWTYSCGADVETLPAISAGGDIVFGCNDGGLHVLKPGGALRFRVPVGQPIGSSPAVAWDGTIYFGARDKRLHALDARGKTRWRVLTGDEIDSAPRIAPDGMVYVGSDDRHLYAVSPQGRIVWYHRTGGAVRSRPALGRDGTIYVTSFDQALHALTPRGARKWRYQTAGQILSSPAVSAEGRIAFGSRDHHLYLLDPEGKLRWRFATAGEVDSEPAFAADGSIIFGSDDGNLYALSDRGELRWWFPAGAEIRGHLVVRADGTVILGAMDGAVVAVAPPGSPQAPTAAPESPRIQERLRLGRGRVGPVVELPDGGLLVAGADGVARAIGADRWPRWSVRAGTGPLSPPLPLGEDLFLSDGSGSLAAVRDGQLRFRLRLDRAPLTPPVAFRDGTDTLILAGAATGRLWAVTGAGKVRWFWSGPAGIRAAPVTLGATILVAAGDELVAVDRSGNRAWSRSFPQGIRAGPVTLGGQVLVAAGDHRLVALSATGQPRWERQLRGGVRALRISREGDAVVALTGAGVVIELAADGEPLLEAPAPSPRHTLVEVAGPRILLAGPDGAVLAVDRRTGGQVPLVDLGGVIRSSAPHAAGGLWLVSGDGTVSLLSPARR